MFIAERGSLHFRKAYALRYRCRKCRHDRLYTCIRGEWAFQMWHWSKFQWHPLWCSGWLQRFFVFASSRACSIGAPLYFLKKHSQRYRHRNMRNGRMNIRGELTFRRWPWIKCECYHLCCLWCFHTFFLPVSVHFRIMKPSLLQKSITWAIRMIGHIFLENSSLECGL